MEDYRGQVAEVDLHPWRGAYSIHEVEIKKTSGKVLVPFIFNVLRNAFIKAFEGKVGNDEIDLERCGRTPRRKVSLPPSAGCDIVPGALCFRIRSRSRRAAWESH